MRHRFPLAAAFALMSCTLAACAGPGTTEAPASPTPATPAASVRVVTDPATIGTYVPASVEVHAGDTVRWDFEDLNPHTISGDDANSFNSGTKSKGQSFSHRFASRGTFNYHCNIHPEMHGTVVVS